MASAPRLTPEFSAYNSGPALARAVIPMTLLAAAVVWLRLWARFIQGHGLFVDDWIIILAQVSLANSISAFLRRLS